MLNVVTRGCGSRGRGRAALGLGLRLRLGTGIPQLCPFLRFGDFWLLAPRIKKQNLPLRMRNETMAENVSDRSWCGGFEMW